MKGRQIRWENALRGAAVVAAGVAVIAALPSLLSSPRPAAPPADVGLATLPAPAPPPPAGGVVPAPAPPAPAPSKASEPARKENRRMRDKRDRAKGNPPVPGKRRGDRKRADDPTATDTAPAPIAPAPVYLAPPPSRERFGFEG